MRLFSFIYPHSKRGNMLGGHIFYRCTLVNDVRTLYINRDPKLLDLIASVEAVEKMAEEDLKKAA